MKKYVLPILSGFISTYSLLMVFHAPLKREFFEEATDYYTANIYELLGEYNFLSLIVFALCLFLFLFLQKKGFGLTDLFRHAKEKKSLPFLILSLFFGFSFALGKYYTEAGTSFPLFDSRINVLKFILCAFGFILLAFPVLTAFAKFLNELPGKVLSEDSSSPEKSSFNILSQKSAFWNKNSFLKAFLILLICYLPFLVLSYPGNLCYDVIGQIEQVLNHSYSAHHPLLHSLWVGGFVSLGGKYLSSYDTGLSLYVLSQTVLLLLSFSAVIFYFAKRKIPDFFLNMLLLLFILTPIYTNLTTTALKDVPFTAFVVLYLILYSDFCLHPENTTVPSLHLLFAFVQIGVICMRNNGLPLVVLSGIIAVIWILVKTKKMSVFLRCTAAFLLESLIISQLFLLLLGNGLHAEKGSKGEIFSLPFQQTAYYLAVTEGQIPEDELKAIENILGDEETIRERYDVTIADPVKALYKKDASLDDLTGYFSTYLKGGIKHPYIYARAFLLHTYGWYCPSVTNEIRYETDYETIGRGTPVANADKLMIFFYRFANRTFPFGLLENIGFAFWGVLFLTVFGLTYEKKSTITVTPHWIGFLVCLASPCFFNHPRYALPILAGLPFSFLFIVFTKEARKNV